MVAVLAAHQLSAVGYDHLTLDDVTNLPNLVVVVGPDVVALVEAARAAPPLADVPMLAVTDDPAAAVAAGATDSAFPHLAPLALAQRVRNLVVLGRLGGPWAPGALGPVLVQINDILAAQGDDIGALTEVLQLTRECLKFDRASLLAHMIGSEHAFVIAATDDPGCSQFTLSIEDYPEVAEAIRTGTTVLIDDALSHPLTAARARPLGGRVRGVCVYPVTWRGRPLGAILLRKGTPGARHVIGRGAEFLQLIGTLTAAHLRHGAVLETLRDQSHRISRLGYEAERCLRSIDSLKEHFEAAADGVAIVNDQLSVLFVNQAAERIIGRARGALVGRSMSEWVVPDAVGVVAAMVERIVTGGSVDAFDLDLIAGAGQRRIVSISSSTVLSATGAAILTFRDVTAQRAMESELRATKDFLERLIDSAVDAIVAADLRGNVMLFNQGAERLFGYRADEVIGRLPVWSLYDDGVPRQIMRMLRSTAHGGVGHLEPTRREVKSKSGELVPVTMTASIIYEGGHEVATVGIFSDLRDRIHIEQRLLLAQEKLQVSEKQALVAELAGATAHELNQPLTSILGYAELIQRQSPPDAEHLRAVAVIREQAERMADIVKKIGRITRYETMPYVGGASIIDLERSTAGDIDLARTPVPSPRADARIERGIPTRAREFATMVLTRDQVGAPARDPSPGPTGSADESTKVGKGRPKP